MPASLRDCGTHTRVSLRDCGDHACASLRDCGVLRVHPFGSVESYACVPSGLWSPTRASLRDCGVLCVHPFGTVETIIQSQSSGLAAATGFLLGKGMYGWFTVEEARERGVSPMPGGGEMVGGVDLRLPEEELLRRLGGLYSRRTVAAVEVEIAEARRSPRFERRTSKRPSH